MPHHETHSQKILHAGAGFLGISVVIALIFGWLLPFWKIKVIPESWSKTIASLALTVGLPIGLACCVSTTLLKDQPAEYSYGVAVLVVVMGVDLTLWKIIKPVFKMSDSDFQHALIGITVVGCALGFTEIAEGGFKTARFRRGHMESIEADGEYMDD